MPNLRPTPALLDRIAAPLHDMYVDALAVSRTLTSGAPRHAVDALIGKLCAVISSINAQRSPGDVHSVVAMRHTATALSHLVRAAELLADNSAAGHEPTITLRLVQSAVNCLYTGYTNVLRALTPPATPTGSAGRAAA